MITPTQDIKSPWLNVIRRLQSIARCDNQGMAIIELKILVDQEGNPRFWTEPEITRIEPKKAAEEILLLLTNHG